MSSSIFRILPLFVAFLPLGCDSGPPSGILVGTVTLDGQPLKDGIVNFIPVDGKSQTSSAVIKEGQFRATLPLTEMKLQFSAQKVVGKIKMYNTPDSPTADDVQDIIPPKYGVQSDIKVTLVKGTQEKTFELKGK